MSKRRKQVGAHYNEIAKDTPTSAAHVRRLISAIYNRQRQLGEELPPDNPALRGIDYAEAHAQMDDSEKPRLRPSQFGAWLDQLRRLPALHRSFHLANLLTGTRGGELARTTWADLCMHRDPDGDGIDRRRTLVIGNSKNGSNIVIPLSASIARVLKLARDAARASGVESDLIWPGAESWRDDLSATGHDLRRAYKPIAASIGLPEEISERVIGHSGTKISKTYNDHIAVIRGAFFRGAQRSLSREMIRLFGCDPTFDRTDAPLPPSPRDVARAAGLERYVSTQVCPKGHLGERYVATNRCCPCTLDRNFRQKGYRANWRRKRRAR